MIDNDLLYKKISNASAFVVIKTAHSLRGRCRFIDVAKLREWHARKGKETRLHLARASSKFRPIYKPVPAMQAKRLIAELLSFFFFFFFFGGGGGVRGGG